LPGTRGIKHPGTAPLVWQQKNKGSAALCRCGTRPPTWRTAARGRIQRRDPPSSCSPQAARRTARPQQRHLGSAQAQRQPRASDRQGLPSAIAANAQRQHPPGPRGRAFNACLSAY